MLLDETRKDLLEVLPDRDAIGKIKEKVWRSGSWQQFLRPAVWKWWHAYKAWEATDTFKIALEEGRLCMSQRTKNTYDMEASKLFGVATKTPVKGYKYAATVESVKQRMNPTNFETAPVGGLKLKYKLGLLDLSGTLLNPEYKTLKGQLRWPFKNQDDADAKPVIFMPLPKPEDVALYYTLKIFSAASQDGDMQALMRFIRHRMTLVVLASGGDMGVGNYIMDDKAENPTVKYGWAMTTSKETGERVLTSKTVQRREMARNNYQDVLKLAKKATGQGDIKVVTSNEITIAIREHNGPRFPIVTQFYFSTNDWEITEGGDGFPEGRIPDNWSNAVEAPVGKI